LSQIGIETEKLVKKFQDEPDEDDEGNEGDDATVKKKDNKKKGGAGVSQVKTEITSRPTVSKSSNPIEDEIEKEIRPYFEERGGRIPLTDVVKKFPKYTDSQMKNEFIAILKRMCDHYKDENNATILKLKDGPYRY